MWQTNNIIELENVGSTNDYAEKLIRIQKVPEGTIILAHEQTAGKGQGKNRWESEAGKNLTFTIILFPHFLRPERQFQLNKVITLGILDFLVEFPMEETCSIKWPNDLYAGNHKIGGVLISNFIQGNSLEACIAGIGINVNQEVFGPDLLNPVSIRQLTGKEYPLRNVLESLGVFIGKRYQQLESGILKFLEIDYRNHLFGIDRWMDYLVNGKPVNGRIHGVDETGRLLLETKKDQVKILRHEEVEFILK